MEMSTGKPSYSLFGKASGWKGSLASRQARKGKTTTKKKRKEKKWRGTRVVIEGDSWV